MSLKDLPPGTDFANNVVAEKLKAVIYLTKSVYCKLFPCELKDSEAAAEADED